ncbi:MAG: leucyl aminopeptidase family protein [Armatimonadetes bacterium]|nr:leucyl aminopeptidase family protein [Armatimonadota bacterium]
MTTRFVHTPVSRPELMIYAQFQGGDLPVDATPEMTAASKRSDFDASAGTSASVFPANAPRALLIGLGEKDKWSHETARKVAEAIAPVIIATKAGSVQFDLRDVPLASEFGREFGVALAKAGWDGRSMVSKKDDDRKVETSALEENFDKGLIAGLGLGTSVNMCRDLVNTPPNIATPKWMADYAMQVGKEAGLEVSMISGDGLDEHQLVGLQNVGRASINEPCLIRIEYKPSDIVVGQPVVLVGKTITYDTGGLSIKGKDGMPGMKCDKGGGCAVLAAMHAIATVIKPKAHVVALLVAAENCISENAYRPDDVITYRNGVTVEVTNTDAEGRLVLADGLIWACEVERASKIVDMATLTGGVVTALGHVFAGGFGNDDGHYSALEQAGKSSGDKMWRLPLHDEYKEYMKSPIADIVNSVKGGKAHPVQGGTFLSFFVEEGTPWVHIDIAGKAMPADGPTGFGVRILAEWLEQTAS